MENPSNLHDNPHAGEYPVVVEDISKWWSGWRRRRLENQVWCGIFFDHKMARFTRFWGKKWGTKIGTLEKWGHDLTVPCLRFCCHWQHPRTVQRDRPSSIFSDIHPCSSSDTTSSCQHWTLMEKMWLSSYSLRVLLKMTKTTNLSSWTIFANNCKKRTHRYHSRDKKLNTNHSCATA